MVMYVQILLAGAPHVGNAAMQASVYPLLHMHTQLSCQKPDPNFRSLSWARQAISLLGVPFSLARRCAPSLLCGCARSYAVFVYCHPVVFTVAQYHSLIVLERSRIATRVSMLFGASDSHSLVVLILLHTRHGIVVVVFLHARRGIVVVVFLPARRGLQYAQQTSLMRGGLPSCPVQPSVCAVVFRSAQRGMHGGLAFCSAWHVRHSSFPPGAACPAVFRSAQCGIRRGLPFCLARPGMCGGVLFCLAWLGVRSGVPFCPAWYRCFVLSGAARCARRSSVLPGAARSAFFRSARCGMHGILPFCLGWHARRSPVPPSAAYAAVFRSVWCGLVCTAVLRVRHRWSRITRRAAG